MTTIGPNQPYGSTSQSPSGAALAPDPVGKFKEFMDAARKGPGEFWRAQYLASQGLTEEDVAAMTQEDREKLEKEIEEFIKAKIEEKQQAVEKQTLPNQKIAESTLGHMVLSSMQNNDAVSLHPENDEKPDFTKTRDEKERENGFL